MNTFWRITKRILIALSILAVVVLLAGFIIIRFFEDDVVKYALGRINNQLNTPAHVDEVDLTWWESFPLASLRFQNVYIQETFATKDTLLHADELYLSFSILDVFSGNYSLKEFSADGAQAYLKVNKKGEDNWHFWKTDSTSKGTDINLKAIRLNRSQVVYEDESNQLFLDVFSEETKAKGAFQSEEFELSVDLSGKMNSFVSGNTEYASNRAISVSGEIDSNTPQKKYTFKETQITVDELPFLIKGEVITDKKGKLDLSISGDDLELDEVLQRIPEAYRDKVAKYNANGILQIALGITGFNNSPVIKAELSVAGGEIKQSDSGTSLSNIDTRASYVFRNKADLLTIHQLSANLGVGKITAKGKVEQLSAPKLNVDLDMAANLTDLKNFFAWDTLEVCEGELIANAHIENPTGEQNFNWNALLASGKAEIINGHFKLKSSSREFKDVGALFFIHNADASVQNFKGTVNGSDFLVNGTLRNLIPFLSQPDQVLDIDASFNSKMLDFTTLVEENESTSSSSDYAFALPANLRFKLNTQVEKFKFKTFEATAIRGIAEYANNVISVNPVTFKAAGGELMASLAISKVTEQSFGLQCKADLKNIQIQQLFTSFDNFGQTFLTDKNIKGRATAAVSFSAPLSSGLKIDVNKIFSLIDIRIDEGQLTNLESLQQIATYIKENKWVAPFVDEDEFAKKLKDVRFSTLENVIEIKNRMITIPLMNIRSSAMDISARGAHGFDNVIDYTIGFRIRDILIKKEKEWQEADDGLGKQMFIYMKGPVSNPQFGVDKSASKENRQAEMEAEKQNVKALLKQELGLFKKDASVGTYTEKPEEGGARTTIEWEGSVTPTEEKPTPKKKKQAVVEEEAPKDPNKKVPKWLQEKDDTEDE